MLDARGARNLVVVILDSLRYDSWVAAEPEALARLGPVERRWSYATWTAPSLTGPWTQRADVVLPLAVLPA